VATTIYFQLAAGCHLNGLAMGDSEPFCRQLASDVADVSWRDRRRKGGCM